MWKVRVETRWKVVSQNVEGGKNKDDKIDYTVTPTPEK
jgi:hypothetical protein